MDSNEKKSKRPRIGEQRMAASETHSTENTGAEYSSEQTSRPYNSDRQGGYNRERQYSSGPRNNYGSRQGGYRNYNNDRQGGYRPRYENTNADDTTSTAQTEGAEPAAEGSTYRQHQGYRNYDNNRQSGGYNNHRQGGYGNNRYNNDRQGSYSNNRYNNDRQGSYSNNRYNNDRQGGYRPRYENTNADDTTSTAQTEGAEPAAEGSTYRQHQGYRNYDNNRQSGGYNNHRQGGYGNNRYNNDRQGSYSNNRYNNDRQGSYSNNRYNNDRQGSYGNNRYNNDRQGSYSNNRYNNDRQGNSYGNRQGGYNNNNRYGNNRQGGYNNRPGRPQMRQNEFGMPHGGKSFTPRPKRVIYEEAIPDPNEQIRLNKFMANAGICSRREADEYIQQGLVKVNGVVVTELGTKITHNDTVEYDEKLVALERKCYILLNKPKDCVTTSDDPNGRLTVMDLVKNACEERIYPVGRLDRNTTGVLLLTNDGDLASKLTHPKYVKKKIYHVWTDKDITEDDMQRIADGIELEDGPIHADAISYATDTDRNQAGIEIHSGRNRIVRRIFESLGYHVTKLDRVYFAGLTKKNLPRGRWRYLTQEEVNFLKMGSFE